jgi:hypothetical protein
MKTMIESEKNETPSTEPESKNSLIGSEELKAHQPPEPQRPNDPRCFRAPMPGFVWNPIRTYPRNNPCPCRSGQKFKACCLNRLPPAVPEELARQYREQMKKPDLIFITKENEGYIKSAIDELSVAGEGAEDATPINEPRAV